MSEASEGAVAVKPKGKAKSPVAKCRTCGVKAANRGLICVACLKIERDKQELAFRAELAKEDGRADLLCLRWVQENLGQDIPTAATDKRRYYKELFERSVKEFHAAAEKAEAEFAASKQVAAGPKARADEGLDRCIQIARDWLRDNAPEGK